MPKVENGMKNDSIRSAKKEYGREYNDAQPGDIIVGTAYDLSHPALVAGWISRNYLFYGAVKGFTYMDWDTGHKWPGNDGIVRNQERLIVDWILPECDGFDPRFDVWDVIPPCSCYCRVVAKKGDPEMLGINPFIKRELKRHFVYVVNEGWVHKESLRD